MITEIGKSVFRNCRALTEINLPQNLSLLGSGAFENCSSLKEIHLPYGVWHIEENESSAGRVGSAKLRGNPLKD